MNNANDTAASDLVIVGLRGGDAGNANIALAVDTDPGNVGPVEWLALVRRDLVGRLVVSCGAEVVDAPRAWDGSRFGDGAGTVRRDGDKVVGDGCYTREWIAARA